MITSCTQPITNHILVALKSERQYDHSVQFETRIGSASVALTQHGGVWVLIHDGYSVDVKVGELDKTTFYAHAGVVNAALQKALEDYLDDYVRHMAFREASARRHLEASLRSIGADPTAFKITPNWNGPFPYELEATHKETGAIVVLRHIQFDQDDGIYQCETPFIVPNPTQKAES